MHSRLSEGDGDVAGDAPQAREQQAEQEGQAERLESAEKGICFIEIFKTLFNQFYSLEAVVERSKRWKDSSTTWQGFLMIWKKNSLEKKFN